MVLLVLLALIGPAFAHGSAEWIARGAYTSPVDGQHCCGVHDCAEVPPEFVHEVVGGFSVRGPVNYFGVFYNVNEVVPHREVQPSKDGGWWRCKKGNGDRRCFFGPPPAM